MLSDLEAIVLKNDMIAKAAVVHKGSDISGLKDNTRFDVICDYYNSVASPQVDLWRPDVTTAEITNVIVMSAFIALSQGARDAWIAMSKAGVIDATLPLVRTNFVSIFGNNTATTIAVTALAKKPATNFEALFVTSGASSMYKYLLTAEDIYQAIRA